MSKGFGNMMRQAQQMQKKMEEAKAEFEKEEINGEAGQGSVKVTVSGGGKLKAIVIDPKVIDPDDAETLQDLIVVAVNQATDEAKAKREEKMNALTGGFKIPGM